MWFSKLFRRSAAAPDLSQMSPEEIEVHELDEAKGLLPECDLTHPVFSLRNYELYKRHQEYDLARWQLRGIGELLENDGTALSPRYWEIVKSSQMNVVDTVYATAKDVQNEQAL